MVFEKMLPLPRNLIPDYQSVLLVGRDGTCKTSLLFRYCHTIAEKFPDRVVIFISPIKLFEMPLPVEGMKPLSLSTSRQVTIFYPINLEDLIEYFAKFFTLNLFPCAFIVDDLDFIIKRKKVKMNQSYASVLSRVFALLMDNVEHCRTLSGERCELVVASSFESNMIEDFEMIKAVGEHFFEEVFTLNEHELFGSTEKGFEIVPSEKSYKIIFKVQDDLIKLKQVLRKKEKSNSDENV